MTRLKTPAKLKLELNYRKANRCSNCGHAVISSVGTITCNVLRHLVSKDHVCNVYVLA